MTPEPLPTPSQAVGDGILTIVIAVGTVLAAGTMAFVFLG